jgi:hypothetical protein
VERGERGVEWALVVWKEDTEEGNIVCQSSLQRERKQRFFAEDKEVMMVGASRITD